MLVIQIFKFPPSKFGQVNCIPEVTGSVCEHYKHETWMGPSTLRMGLERREIGGTNKV
jgi:hypothetical protein